MCWGSHGDGRGETGPARGAGPGQGAGRGCAALVPACSSLASLPRCRDPTAAPWAPVKRLTTGPAKEAEIAGEAVCLFRGGDGGGAGGMSPDSTAIGMKPGSPGLLLQQGAGRGPEQLGCSPGRMPLPGALVWVKRWALESGCPESTPAPASQQVGLHTRESCLLSQPPLHLL